MITRETDSRKQESNASGSSSSTTSWSRLKDPRIVRVSRAFGGKDRHSKVCTVRGLRDRRVRLSVPTAIQLYDLQDRLGLSQPSKVVDWLLNAAKHEIDELPPLQIPPGIFGTNPSLLQMLNSNEIRSSQSEKHGEEKSAGTSDRDDHLRQFDLQNQEAYVSPDNFQSRQNPSSLTSLMNGSAPSYNSIARWDPANLTLSHPPRSHGLSPNQPEDWHNFSLLPLQPAVPVPSGTHQVLVYQPGMSTQSYFPSQIGGSNAHVDQKQLHFQSAQLSPVDSATQSVRPIHFNMTANLLPSQNND